MSNIKKGTSRERNEFMWGWLFILPTMIGLIILNGWNFTSVKMILVVVFLWFASPVASHVLARFEVATNEKSEGCYEDKTTKV